jgi:hypothetical protein
MDTLYFRPLGICLQYTSAEHDHNEVHVNYDKIRRKSICFI